MKGRRVFVVHSIFGALKRSVLLKAGAPAGAYVLHHAGSVRGQMQGIYFIRARRSHWKQSNRISRLLLREGLNNDQTVMFIFYDHHVHDAVDWSSRRRKPG